MKKKQNQTVFQIPLRGLLLIQYTTQGFVFLSLSSTTAKAQRTWKEKVWQSLPNGNPSSSKVLLNKFSPAREKTNRLLNCKQFSKTTITAT